tara:strand:+ start:1676 stop:1903 length:228 start_codon:yes stop_codon:yes gene_type:complete
MSTPLEELQETVEHHVKNVKHLMMIIKKQRADIELAFGLMTPEQQEVFITTVRIADEQAKEIKDKYEARDVDEEE